MHDKQIDELCDAINEGIFGGSMPTRPTNTRGHRHQTGDTLKAALKYQSEVEKVIKKKKKKQEKKKQRSFDRLPNSEKLSKLQWLRKSRNESIDILASDINTLLEATKKAHSWPKGGGKICDKGLASAKKKYKGKWSAYAAGYASQVCKGTKK